jgi:diguanylate cyclase (GGDEF)-like protein
MGVVSLDLTNSRLSEILDSPYESYLVDDTDSVIATSLNVKFQKENIKFDTLLNTSQSEVKKLKELSSGEMTYFDKYYVYSVAFQNAPWKMYFRVPIWSIASEAVLYTLPLSVICVLLLFTFREMERRKKTETQLKSSLAELTSYQTLLENAAKYDFLTGTVNRRGLFDIYHNNVESDSAAKGPIVFIMGDIDYFKQFNDTYGHAAGDKVLKEIAVIMQKDIKKDDIVCRWGGEEFVIMLLGSTYDEAMLIAEKIRMEIEATVIPWENSIELRATMTFGVVEHNRTDSITDSISKADAALYEGKANHRNRVVGYSK